MAVPLYFDVHVPRAIAEQLRPRGVDVLTAIEDGYDHEIDEEVLLRARNLHRVLFTQDIRFKALAEDWQRQGIPFADCSSVIRPAPDRRYVADLELVAKVSEPEEWKNVVGHLPF